MPFFQSIQVCFTKYADFNGRASRPEFWWFTLAVILAGTALSYISRIFVGVFLIAILLPFLATDARRLHDTGKSGWWQLFLLIPIAGFVVPAILWALPAADLAPEGSPQV